MLFSLAAISTIALAMNGILLKNSANPGMKMPLCGLGTGGYGNNVYQKLGKEIFFLVFIHSCTQSMYIKLT